MRIVPRLPYRTLLSPILFAPLLVLGISTFSATHAQEESDAEKPTRKVPPPVLREEAAPVTTEDGKNIVRDSEGNLVEETAVDRLYRNTTALIQGTTGYFDKFFFAETEDAFTGNATRVRLRLNTDYIDGHGWDVSPNVRLNLALPFLNDKIRLVMNEDTDEDQGSAAADSAEGSDLALRWVELDGDRLGLSFDLGLRLSGVGYPESTTELAGFGRVNASLRFDFGKWNSRSNNRLYYYSNTGVRNDFRQYFDRPFENDDFLFRSRTRIQYFEENGYNPEWEQKLTLFHKLNEKSAIAYEAIVERYALENSIYDPDEITVGLQESYYAAQVRVRYRRNIWRPWLFFEIWPIAAFPEERDYELTPVVRFRLEVNFGPESPNETQIDE